MAIMTLNSETVELTDTLPARRSISHETGNLKASIDVDSIASAAFMWTSAFPFPFVADPRVP
jgi:hypothetical protein